MSKNDNAASLYHSIPAVAALNKVPGFDPIKLLRRVVAPDGTESFKLDPPYQKLWFRLAYPQGKVRLKPLRITDQMAIFEAQVYLRKDDTEPIGNFTSSILRSQVSNGKYVQAAQDEAVSKALEDAGFGIQLADIAGQETPQYHTGATSTPPVSMHTQVVTAPKPQPVTNAPAVTAPNPEPAVVTVPAIQEEQPKPVADPAAAPMPQAIIPKTEEPVQRSGADEALDILRRRTMALSGQKQPQAETTAPKYFKGTPVEEIIKLMTLDEAKAVVVDEGICRGKTMGEVAAGRVASVRFFLTAGYTGDNNIMRAAAKIILNDLDMKKAS